MVHPSSTRKISCIKTNITTSGVQICGVIVINELKTNRNAISFLVVVPSEILDQLGGGHRQQQHHVRQRRRLWNTRESQSLSESGQVCKFISILAEPGPAAEAAAAAAAAGAAEASAAPVAIDGRAQPPAARRGGGERRGRRQVQDGDGRRQGGRNAVGCRSVCRSTIPMCFCINTCFTC